KISYVNEAYADMFDRSVAELEGRKLLDLFPDTVGTPSYLAYMQVLETKQAKVVQFEYQGHKYRETIYPVVNGLISLIQEIPEDKPGPAASGAEYRAIFDEVNDALFIYDVRSSSILDANQRASQMFGYSREELRQLGVADLSAEEPPFSKDVIIQWIKKVASNNPQTQVVEWLAKDRSGRVFWVEVKCKSTYIQNREYLLAIIRDITDIKETRRKLKESTDRYMELFENSSDLVYVHDLEGNYLRVNKVVEKVTGYWREELLNMNVNQIIAEESRKQHERYLAFGRRMAQQKKGKHKPLTYETEIVTKHGARVFLEVSAWLIYKDHEAVAIQGIARDITSRKIEELAIKESHQFMVDFIEYLPDAVMAIDLEGKVTVWNNAMEELTGIAAEQMVGKSNYEYAIPFYGKRRPILIDLVLRPENIERNYAEIKQEHYVLTGLVEVPVLKGEKHQLWARAVPLYDREGNLIGAIEALRDMTEYQRIQDAKTKSR
ncbi:MAG: PAS domain S-box protein, partial [Bacillota bacterium]